MEVIQDRKTSPNLKKSNSVTFEFDAKPDSVETEAARSIQKSKDDQLSDRQLNAAPSAIPNDPRTSESKPNTETITKRFQQTLNDLVKQMDILTETMSILEVLQSNKSRLTINEDRMDAIVKEISKISTSKRNPKISGQSEKSSKGMDSLLGHYE